MRKTMWGLLAFFAAVGFAAGLSGAIFNDPESASGSTEIEDVDISVDGENPWTKSYEFADFLPGESKEIVFTVRNAGKYPAKIWQIVKNVETAENGITEPEQDWYDKNGVEFKNDLDSAIIFEMDVNGEMVVNKEAEFFLLEIKDSYLNLVKLDQPFGPSKGDGILYPGETILISQKYHFSAEGLANWAQSDTLSFEIELLAQQIDAPEPLHLMTFLDNKYNNNTWKNTKDEKLVLLKYDSMGDDFRYRVLGKNLPSGKYELIYYPDPWKNPKPIFSLSGDLVSNGEILDSGQTSFDLGIDLPTETDDNHPFGAKVWLVPALAGSNLPWSPKNDTWFFDSWPGLINYKQGESVSDPDPTEPTTTSLSIDGVLSDVDWTGDTRDYSLADVEFTFQDPAQGNRLSGNVSASGLKPYTTYQVKFIGKPTCQDGAEGNDVANEYIGYLGRWTVTNVACSGAGCNRTDAQYEASKTNSECVAGYLVWDFFTTDGSGNATKSVVTDCSYHVLWCNGGTCGAVNNSQLKYLPEAGLEYHYCQAGDVEGEIERGTCGGLTLASGNYDLNLVLTEESFHKPEGVWTTVLGKDISFIID